MDEIEVLVVGAGAVGLAVGRELAQAGRQVGVLERHARIGAETSSRNSEVIHSGIHYRPGSLKARLCVEGVPLLYEAAREYGIPSENTGKITVAETPEEVRRIEDLAAQGQANGVEGLEVLTGAQVKRLEPEVRAAAGLLSPSTGLISAHGLMDFLAAGMAAAGGLLALGQEAIAIEPRPGGFAVTVRGERMETYSARCVVNCAGLSSDRIAGMLGLSYRLHWAKGDYFSLSRAVRGTRLIYPVPEETGLGIHLTRKMGGGCRVGPDVEYVDRREPPYPGPAGPAAYIVDEAKRPLFHREVMKYLPGVREEELVPEMYGIRPKLQGPDDGFTDFAIRAEEEAGFPRFIDCVGIESPGLTACLAIGRHVAGLVADKLG